jgi:hypothetical protein
MAVTTATDRKNEKLTKVISTKLSVQDYNLFQILTNLAYQHRLFLLLLAGTYF